MSETNKEEANNYMCTSDSDEEMYQQNSTYNTSTDNKQYQLQLYMIGTRIIKEFKGGSRISLSFLLHSLLRWRWRRPQPRRSAKNAQTKSQSKIKEREECNS